MRCVCGFDDTGKENKFEEFPLNYCMKELLHCPACGTMRVGEKHTKEIVDKASDSLGIICDICMIRDYNDVWKDVLVFLESEEQLVEVVSSNSMFKARFSNPRRDIWISGAYVESFIYKRQAVSSDIVKGGK